MKKDSLIKQVLFAILVFAMIISMLRTNVSADSAFIPASGYAAIGVVNASVKKAEVLLGTGEQGTVSYNGITPKTGAVYAYTRDKDNFYTFTELKANIDNCDQLTTSGRPFYWTNQGWVWDPSGNIYFPYNEPMFVRFGNNQWAITTIYKTNLNPNNKTISMYMLGATDTDTPQRYYVGAIVVGALKNDGTVDRTNYDIACPDLQATNDLGTFSDNIENPISEISGSGLSFNVTDLYKTSKEYTVTPNTFQASIRLATHFVENGGGIIYTNDTGSNNSVITFDVSDGGHPRLRWKDSRGASTDWTFTDVNVCTNEFVHISIVRDVEKMQICCYIDGKLKQTLKMEQGKGTENFIPSERFVLGGDAIKGNPGYFRGWCRELAILSDVRTDAELAEDAIYIPAYAPGVIVCYDLSTAAPRTNKNDISPSGYNLIFQNNYNWIRPQDKPPVEDYAYSFAVIPDPQILNWKYPENYHLIFDYVRDNIEAKKIKMVLGVGDLVQTNTVAEWQRVKDGVYSFDGKVAYQMVRGNHDDVAPFKAAFPYSKYANELVSAYNGDMLNSCYRMTIGNVKYLFIGLDYGAGDGALSWAGDLCEQYPDHNVVVTTHAFLDYDGTPLSYSNSNYPPKWEGALNNCDDMWTKFLSKYENITMVICGHQPADGILVSKMKGDHGNTVTALLVDGQCADGMNVGGLGFVGMMYFSADGRNVKFDYYSTVKEQYFLERNQFTFTLDTVDPSTPPSTDDPTQPTEPSGTTNPVDPSTTNNPEDSEHSSDPTEVTGSVNPDTSAKDNKYGVIVAVIACAVICIGVAACIFFKMKTRRK